MAFIEKILKQAQDPKFVTPEQARKFDALLPPADSITDPRRMCMRINKVNTHDINGNPLAAQESKLAEDEA
jgi:hypothetical protein